MRISINKRLKIGLIAVLIIVFCGVSFLLYREANYPGFREEKVVLYGYNNAASVDYRVYLKENELYNSMYLDEGQIYITELVDNIDTTFRYEFTGDKPKDLGGNYNIIAKVQGYSTGKDNNIIIIWEKDFTLVPTTAFTIDSEKKVIEESLNITLQNYNDFASRILEATKIKCSTSLNVIMNINIEGDTGVGHIKETITPTMTIPLNTSMFEISGNTDIEKPGAIEETRQVQMPVNRKLVSIYAIIVSVLLLALGYVSFFTVSKLDNDPYKKQLKSIFKKYGDRFVALKSEIEATNEGIIPVNSIDDLVRVSDELGKPILYKYCPDYRDISSFYVVSEDEIYILSLRDMEFKNISS
ncbi:MAG TPA: DUF5305 domain-containing protein [Tissierellia bacterium]|nr:DUF5305 domain-containing protein [Tissierellia bacterium]